MGVVTWNTSSPVKLAGSSDIGSPVLERDVGAQTLDVGVDVLVEQAQAEEGVAAVKYHSAGVEGGGAERLEQRVATGDRQGAGGADRAPRVQVAQLRARHHLGAPSRAR
jgi:hypothetical protein